MMSTYSTMTADTDMSRVSRRGTCGFSAVSFIVHFLFALFIALPLIGTAHAQTGQASTKPFSVTVAGWNRDLDRIAAYTEQGRYDKGRSDTAKEMLSKIKGAATAVASDARNALGNLEPQLTALGPEPAEGQPAESAEVRKKRADLSDEIAAQKAKVSLAEATIARIDGLNSSLSQLEADKFVSGVLKRFPLPFMPDTVGSALKESIGVLHALLNSGPEWWAGISDQQQGTRLTLTVALFMGLALLLAYIVKRTVLDRFGVDPAIETPSYARRLLAAFAEGLARGILPSTLLVAVIIRTKTEDSLIAGQFGTLLSWACFSIILYILSTALPHAVLAPEHPNWRVTRITARNAQSLIVRIHGIALLFAIAVFTANAPFVLPVGESISGNLISFMTMVLGVPISALLLSLLQPSLWERGEDDQVEDHDAASMPDGAKVVHAARSRFWDLLRIAMALSATASVFAVLSGYANLTQYLIGALVGTGLIVSLLYLVRGFLREVDDLAIESGFVRDRLKWSTKTRRWFRFWVRAVIDLIILAVGVFMVLPIWGVPGEYVRSWADTALTGFKVGNVTISITDIFLGIAIFTVILAIFRAFKQTLADRILPETEIDPGLRHSISTGVGYIGFVIALAVAIMVMGIDLSGIAIIAGALSVGIGFGLQNVVNNFVSGLILLIERPVKVGDWVVVGATEGTVKQINVRSTEIETFSRASVIIPNADILSSSVTNWTHKDKYGRIELPIGVAYGTDTRKVESILLDIAKSHQKVLRWPAPFVVFMNFGASSLDFELRCYTDDVLYRLLISSDLRHEIAKRFEAEGIEIPFPQRVVHMAARPDDTRRLSTDAKQNREENGPDSGREEKPGG